MDSINELFDSEIQGDPSATLDADIAASAQWAQKIAEAEGIDLDSLPAADVADLLLKMSGREPDEPQDDKTKEANMSTKQITNVDVSRELYKVAARENVDLSTVSEEEYTEAWNKLAAAMQSPDWEAQQEAEKQAAEEAKAHYEVGVKIAQGFIDSVNAHFEKAAEDGEGKKPPPFMKKDEKEDEEDEESKESAFAAGAPAAPAGGGNDEIEELALKIARQTILDEGYDPDTGEKLSAEQRKVAAAEARAVELLREKNWIS